MDNNQKTKIFGTLEVDSPQTLNILIDNMTKEQSIFLLIESVKYGHNKGLFTLIESEIISKAIRKIHESDNLSDNQEVTGE